MIRRQLEVPGMAGGPSIPKVLKFFREPSMHL